MARMIAVIRWGKVEEIVPLTRKTVARPHDPKDSTARLVDVTGRPDVVVGDSFPFGPEPKKEKEGES
jgi:hypothetical protein